MATEEEAAKAVAAENKKTIDLETGPTDQDALDAVKVSNDSEFENEKEAQEDGNQKDDSKDQG